jgi:hypothetical protein
MRFVRLEDLAGMLERRRRELGITPERLERARNDGRRRTPEKRELLRRMAERARAAGVEPFPAAF